MITWAMDWWWSLVIALIGAYAAYRWGRKGRNQEKALDWHRDVIELHEEVISLGRRMTIGRKVDQSYLEDLRPIAATLHAKSNPPPIWVTTRIDHQTRRKAEISAGVIYHFAHLPTPKRHSNSIAGLFYHLYEMVNLLDLNQEIQVKEIIEKFGRWDPKETPEIDEGEAKKMLREFEKESMQRMDKWEELTVDELMSLPWEMVDDVFSEGDRTRFINQYVDEFSEKVLVEMPIKAKGALLTSERKLG